MSLGCVGLALLVGGVVGCAAPRAAPVAEDAACFASPAQQEGTCADPLAGWACAVPDDAGPAWTNTDLVEAMPGYDEAIAAIDFCALPVSIDLSALSSFERGYLGYALELEPTKLVGSISRDALIARGPLGVAVVAAWAGGGFDMAMFRRGFHRFYGCARSAPATLDAFREMVFDYAAAPARRLVPSVKGPETPRNLYSVDDARCGLFVSVAETVIDGVVRETEIVIDGARLDGSLDFFAYDAKGRRMDRSAFTAAAGAEVVAGSPYVCMSCHFTSQEPGWVFDRISGKGGP